jgi:peptidoglycan hydrolase-like protein with peptidoglycan-binding domain
LLSKQPSQVGFAPAGNATSTAIDAEHQSQRSTGVGGEQREAIMNRTYELKAFDSQPFHYEEEEEFNSESFLNAEDEEVRRSRGGGRPVRRRSSSLRSSIRRKPTFARKLAALKRKQRKRPRRPNTLPTVPLPYPGWPATQPNPPQPPQSAEPGNNPGGPTSSGSQPPPENPDLDQAGSGSERVRWVQTSLNQLLQLNLPTDGRMSAAVRSAVRRFQSQEKLPVTGVVGPDTEQALVAATRKAAESGAGGATAADADAPGPSADAPADGAPASGADQEFSWLSSVLPGLKQIATTGACPAFSPTAMENPGGGRVKNKTAPRPADIVQVKRAFGGTVPLHRLTAKALEALQCAARADGLKAPLLQPGSGFRDPAHQARLWNNALVKYGSAEEARKWVAPPGSSAHQSGRAIDFYLGGTSSSSNVAKLRTLPAYRWMTANARRFGFYPYEREPWHWEYNPPAGAQTEYQAFEAEFEDEGVGPIPSPAPKLIGREQTPPSQTLYLQIPFGAEKPAKPMTGVFLPQSFRPESSVDLIIYLHGVKPKADLTIDRYWNRRYYPTFMLREGLNQSGKNYVLVAPTLGPRSQTQTGWLAKPGGLDKFIDQVLASLAAYGPYQGRRPELGNIILACHSGGGLPMRQLAMGKNRCANKIKECWGFDCLYFTGDETLWAQWAKSRPDARLFIHYQSSTRERSEKLKRKPAPNITVARSAAKGHNWVPIHHWQERLAAIR